MARKQCVECKRTPSGRGHYYMVTDKVWPYMENEVACLDCLSNRLCRPLTLNDFTECELNRINFGLAGLPMHRAFASMVKKGVIVWTGQFTQDYQRVVLLKDVLVLINDIRNGMGNSVQERKDIDFIVSTWLKLHRLEEYEAI